MQPMINGHKCIKTAIFLSIYYQNRTRSRLQQVDRETAQTRKRGHCDALQLEDLGYLFYATSYAPFKSYF